MRTYNVLCGQTTLDLGHAGENLAQEIVFDISSWTQDFGPGSVSLLVRRPQDQQPYPVAVEGRGTDVRWVVSNLDTAQEGYGQAELIYLVENIVVKSRIWKTYIAKSLDGSHPADPETDPWADYMAAVTKAGSDALEAAKESEEILKQNQAAIAHSPIIDPPVNGTWWLWDAQAGKYRDTGIYATGPKGEGIPAGGTKGQMLVKTADTDGATGWATPVTEEELEKKFLGPTPLVAGNGKIRVYLDKINGPGIQTEMNFGTDVNGWSEVRSVFRADSIIAAFYDSKGNQRGMSTIWIDPDSIEFQSRTFNPTRLKGIATPKDSEDAANKGYVDRMGALYLPIAGGTLTGDLVFGNADSGTKIYGTGGLIEVFGADPDGSFRQILIERKNITMLGYLADGGSIQIDVTPVLVSVGEDQVPAILLYGNGNETDPVLVRGVLAPQEDTDAANKKYVDDTEKNFLGKNGVTDAQGKTRVKLELDEYGMFLTATRVNEDGTIDKMSQYVDGIDVEFQSGERSGFIIQKDGVKFYAGISEDPCRLTNIADPVEDTDAATKKFVSDSVMTRLAKTGGTITGSLTVTQNDTKIVVSPANGDLEIIPQNSKTKGVYFHDGFSLFPVGSSGFETGFQAKESGEIEFYATNESGDSPVILSGVKTPTQDDHASNKKYVDDSISAAVGNISAVLDAINGEVA